MFIRYLAEKGHKVAKSDKKPRRNIQYSDLGLEFPLPLSLGIKLTSRIATAVDLFNNLEFLSDVIPKTTTYKQFKEKKAREAAKKAAKARAVEAGQTTLDGKKPVENGLGRNGHTDDSFDGFVNGTYGHEESQSRPVLDSRPTLNGAFVDRTTSHAHPNSGDITMS
jgi:DNA-directed RNA polymerase I subunit RPA43